MSYLSADELVAEARESSTTWESRLDYELVQEILGHSLSVSEWNTLVEMLEDAVFETVMSFKNE